MYTCSCDLGRHDRQLQGSGEGRGAGWKPRDPSCSHCLPPAPIHHSEEESAGNGRGGPVRHTADNCSHQEAFLPLVHLGGAWRGMVVWRGMVWAWRGVAWAHGWCGHVWRGGAWARGGAGLLCLRFCEPRTRPTRAAAGAHLSADPQTGSRRGCHSSWRRCRQRGRTQTAGPGRVPSPCWAPPRLADTQPRAAHRSLCPPTQARPPTFWNFLFSCCCHDHRRPGTCACRKDCEDTRKRTLRICPSTPWGHKCVCPGRRRGGASMQELPGPGLHGRK